MGTPLVIDEEVRGQIKALVQLAEANPVEMAGLLEKLKDPAKKKEHMAQMTRQTIQIPLAYWATYSIEHGHPCGTCRHLSMSVARKDRAPNEVGLWMVAQEFGFWGTMKDCVGVWPEELQGHGMAINIVQPIDPAFSQTMKEEKGKND